MPAKRNNIVPNQHFHKDWQNYVKTWFNQVSSNVIKGLTIMIFLLGIRWTLVAGAIIYDFCAQPARKIRRRQNRIAKAAKVSSFNLNFELKRFQSLNDMRLVSGCSSPSRKVEARRLLPNLQIQPQAEGWPRVHT